MYSFGAGILFGTNVAANSTPTNFGTLQEVSLDFSFSVKELHGSYQFAVCVARGLGKIAMKAKAATIRGDVFNNIFFGQTLAVGSQLVAYNEAGVVIASPLTITVVNSATWLADQGVMDAATGLPLTKVAPGTPTTGQYCVTAGVYTFAVADVGKNVLISYTYTASASGKKIVINNQLLGVTPFFAAAFTSIDPRTQKATTFTLNRCTASKFTFATKLEDFVIPEVDITVCADDAGVIGTVSTGE